MGLRLLAAGAGLIGGGCWVARAFVREDPDDLLGWVGLGLLILALAAGAARLVSALWLRGIVAVAVPLLAWSVLEVVRDSGDDVVVDAVAGGLAVVVAVLVLARSRAGRQVHRH